MTTQVAKLERKVSPAATLRAMTGGMTVTIKTKHIKTPSLRTAAYRLRANGYYFHVSEVGMVDETMVTCIKSPK